MLAVNILVLVLNAFFNAHYLFRWRRAMNFFYMANWQQVRHIEGASQRVQEDTQSFSSIVEGLGLDDRRLDHDADRVPSDPVGPVRTAFRSCPGSAPVPGSLVWLALGSAIFGTLLFAVAGIRLPGLQFANQRVEAAYRKELVYRRGPCGPGAAGHHPRTVPQRAAELLPHLLPLHLLQRLPVRLPQGVDSSSLHRAAVRRSSPAPSRLGIFQQILNAFGQVSARSAS